MKTLKEALEGLLWLIDQGQLIENEPSVCGPSLVNDARGALIDSITAESLAKIDVLEELQKHIDSISVSQEEQTLYACGYYSALTDLTLYIEKLKAGN